MGYDSKKAIKVWDWQIMPDGRLSSPNHIDYSYLRDLLADSQWQQADIETTSLIRLAAEKKELDACLTTTDIETLLTIPKKAKRLLSRGKQNIVS
ncbi:MAG: GUN4 domain-containing protein [Prochloraceae cyanobacterium]|nr:GUN4 domain-containing protein [Prochloraceae cyanobacterium]